MILITLVKRLKHLLKTLWGLLKIFQSINNNQAMGSKSPATHGQGMDTILECISLI